MLLKVEHHPRIYFECQVKVERFAAGILGMQVNFEGLAHAVGLYEVPFIMHVESVLDCVFFDRCDVSGDVQ